MASVRSRKNRDGTTTHSVLFRHAGAQTSRTFNTAKAAEHFKDSIRVNGVQRALEDLEGKPAVDLTLDDYAERFFDFKAKRVRSDRTVHDYRRDYTNWIQPHLGHRQATSIDEGDVQAWVDGMIGVLEPKTIADRHALLHGIFKFAASPARKADSTGGHDPCTITELPARIRKDPKGMRINVWLALYQGLRTKGAQNGYGDDPADLGMFLVDSGWRISEGIALDESSCEDDGVHVHVRMRQVMRRGADSKARLVQDAKSTAGRRTTKLNADTSAMIRRRLITTPKGGLVFRRGDTPWTYSCFHNVYWAGAAKIAGLVEKPGTHAARHTSVGLAIASGASLAEIQKRIGHESIQTTIDVYGGQIDGIRDDTLDKMAELLRGPQAVAADVVRPDELEQ